jgi:hypothetical protein
LIRRLLVMTAVADATRWRREQHKLLAELDVVVAAWRPRLVTAVQPARKLRTVATRIAMPRRQ